MSVEVRQIQDDDLPEVLDVLRSALGEPEGLERTRSLWDWKHVRNPFGRSIVLVADIDGRIAGVRAFMRWDLIGSEGDTIRCVRAVDTATHPDFHRRGVFQTLTTAAVEEARDRGIHLIFNTPNPQSGAGYVKMGWSKVGGIAVMVAPTIRLLSRRLEAPAVIDAPIGPPHPPPPDRAPMGWRTPRTAEYLEWRYGSHPTARYRSVEVAGSAAVLRENVRNGRSELVVSDLLGPTSVAALAEARRRAKAAYLVGSFRSGTPERRAALRCGMVPIPRVRALTLFARTLADIGSVTDLNAWDLTLGDLELL